MIASRKYYYRAVPDDPDSDAHSEWSVIGSSDPAATGPFNEADEAGDEQFVAEFYDCPRIDGNAEDNAKEYAEFKNRQDEVQP